MIYQDPLRVRDVMSTDVASVPEDSKVFSAIEKMTEHDLSSVIVVDSSGRPVGMVNESDVAGKVTNSGRDPKDVPVREIMSEGAISVISSARVVSAGRIMRDRDFDVLPVLEEGRLVGMISKSDVSGALGSLGYFRRVEDIMKPGFVSVPVASLVSEVVDRVVKSDSRYVLVMEDEKIAGIFTEKDLIDRVVSKNLDASKTPVRDVMTPKVITIESDRTVTEANRIQKNNRIKELPVVRDGRVVGLVSENEILRAVEEIKLEYNSLNAIANLAMQNAGFSISQMINREAKISVPSLEYVPVESVPDMMGAKHSLVAGVFIEVTGDLSGSVLLAFPEKMAFLLADLMMGQAEGTTSEMDDTGKSALQELCNILVGSYLKVLVNKLGMDVSYSPPMFAFDMLGSILDYILALHTQRSDYTMMTKTSFKVADRELDGSFLFLFSPESMDKMAKKLGR